MQILCLSISGERQSSASVFLYLPSAVWPKFGDLLGDINKSLFNFIYFTRTMRLRGCAHEDLDASQESLVQIPKEREPLLRGNLISLLEAQLIVN